MQQPVSSEQERLYRTLAYASGVLSAHLALCPVCQEWVRKYRAQQVKPDAASCGIAWCVFRDKGLVPSVRPLRFQVLANLVRERL